MRAPAILAALLLPAAVTGCKRRADDPGDQTTSVVVMAEARRSI